MSHKSNKPVFAASAALAGSLILAGSAFAATPLAQGYMLGAQDAAAASAEKTAEGKCGTDENQAAGEGGAGGENGLVRLVRHGVFPTDAARPQCRQS